MTRDQKIAEAQRLRTQGLVAREIAERLGVTPSTVWKWLNPERARESARRTNSERNEYKRAWDHAHADPCVDCGGQTNAPGVTRCEECNRQHRHDESLARRARFTELRRAGLTNIQIAAQEGVSRQVVGTELYRAKHWDGMDVARSPYWDRAKAAA